MYVDIVSAILAVEFPPESAANLVVYKDSEVH
jgi:hypothetical protein